MADIVGTINDDSLPGTGSDDTITGLQGNDIIQGLDGDDSIDGGSGSDNIDGGDGNDNIDGGDDGDSIIGGAGNDTIQGGLGVDTVSTGSGDDSVTLGDGNDFSENAFGGGADGNDTVYGGDGNDRIWDDRGTNEIYGGEGNDSLWYVSGSTIDGGLGSDSIFYDVESGSGTQEIFGGDGNDTIQNWTSAGDVALTISGGAGNDRIDGTNRNPTVDEVLRGDDGNDTIYGGNWNDDIFGGADDDRLFGGNQDDEVYGGTGNDTLEGGSGNDLLDGGDGDDIATYNGPASRYVITNEAGGGLQIFDPVSGLGRDTIRDIETLRFSDGDVDVSTIVPGVVDLGTTGDDTINGTAQTDSLNGQDGDDVINGLGSTDYIDGGAGNDTISGDTGDDNLIGGIDNDSISGGVGNDTIFGGDGNDSIDGGLDNDVVLTGSGDDTAVLGEGNDSAENAFGGNADGNDTYFGGAGNDRIWDDRGTNEIYGGEGNDTLWYVSGSTIDGGLGNDSIYYDVESGSGTQEIFGGEGNDTIQNWTSAGDVALTISGGAGNDRIDGTNRNPTVNEALRGDAGNDTIYGGNWNDDIEGGADDDMLYGGNQDDTILGEDGDDFLYGGNGNDSLDGGLGADTITGGTGNDTIDGGDVGNIAVFSSVRSNYTITTGALGEATVQDNVGSDGTDIVSNIAILRFTDTDEIIGTNPGVTENGDANANTLTGTEGDDTLNGNGGDDSIIGLGGKDTIDGGADNDSISAGSGDDTVDAGDGNDTVNPGAGADQVVLGDGDDRAEVAFGGNSDGDDTYFGGIGNDRIWDDRGTNEIYGGEGNDSLWYVSGSTIDGGLGNDSIFYDVESGTGTQEIFGGEGNDNFSNWTSTGDVALTISGGVGNDTISGTNRNPTVDEVLRGDDGNDTIYGGNWNDDIFGGEDDDRLFGGNQDDEVYGGTGNDTLEGGSGNDTLEGGIGNDTLEGDGGDDVLDGGDGDDIAVFNGPQSRYVITAGAGGGLQVFDPVSGLGRDTLLNIETLQFTDGSVDAATVPQGIEDLGTTGNDTITGTAQTDFLNGDDGDDSIDGLASIDYIDGGAGNDTLDGGDGGDNLTGGEGNDSIIGGLGSDTVRTGTGDDSVTLGDGNDFAENAFGGANADGNDTYFGGVGNDRIYDDRGTNEFYGGEGNDSLWYVSGSTIDGGLGNDSIFYDVESGTGTQEIFGGEGNDNFSNWTSSGDVALTISGGAGNDTISGTNRNPTVDEVLRGDDGNDTIYGGNWDDILEGGTGNDLLYAGNQDDSLFGGEGDDLLTGGRNDDYLDGGAEDTDIGDIAVFSGVRSQYAVIGDAAGLQVVDTTANRDGTDILVNIETLRFSDGDVAVSSGLIGRTVTGTAGDDNGIGGNPGELVGTILNDVIDGLEGDDSLIGLDGQDSLTGGDGEDTIDAGAEDDSVDAGADNDTIIGGAGDDTIDGGTGLNVAVYAGNRADYLIAGDEASSTVTDIDPSAQGDEGVDTLSNVKILRFADGDFFFNNLPVPDAESFTIDEDSGTLTIAVSELLDGDTDPDGDPLEIVGVQNAVGGSVQLVGSEVRFFPQANFNGAASFEYVLSDSYETVVQTVSITIEAVNDAPVGSSDTAETDFGTSVSIDVTANDTDIEGDTITPTSISVDPSNGTAVIEADGTITYTPDEGFFGNDSFRYIASDGNGGFTNSTFVSVTVTPPPNTPPVGVDDSAAVLENQTVEGSVLDNDTDVDVQNNLTVYAVNGLTSAIGIETELPSGALLTMQPDGTYLYDPNGEFDLANGALDTDSFTYTVSDGEGGFDDATVTINITGVGEAPTASEDNYETDENTAIFGNVVTDDTGSGPDTDPDGDEITVLSVEGRDINDGPITLVSGATVTMSADGSFTYNPAGGLDDLRQGASTIDTFTYVISDGFGGTDTGAAFVDVAGVNDAPEAIDNAYDVIENVVLTGNVLTDDTGDGVDSDIDGDALVVGAVEGNKGAVGTQITLGSGALLTVNADGTFSYDTNGVFASLTYGETDTDSFTYEISDGLGGLDTATVDLTIESVAGAPDLRVTDASFEGGRTDQWLTVEYTVENFGGTTPEGVTWQDRIYLSLDQVLDADDEMLREVNFSGQLDETDFYSRAITVKLPSSPGDFFLLVETDVNDAVLESDEDNNVGADDTAATIVPAYSSTLTADVSEAVTGQSFTLSGQAIDTESGMGEAFVFVTIDAELDGITRQASVLTDINGLWTTEFQSLPTEAGTFNFTARHPGNTEEVPIPEASVDIYGMGLSNNFDTFEIVLGETETFNLTLDNFGDLGLTGLEAMIEGLPASWTGTADLGAMTLDGDGLVSVDLTVTVPVDTIFDFKDIVLSVTSDEGAVAETNLRIDPVVSLADIVIEESFVKEFALRDDQELVTFTISNEGLAPSEPVTIILPDLDWVDFVTPQVIDSIGVGESVSVTIALMPDEDVPFGSYTGDIMVAEADGDIDFLPFQFLTGSSAEGTLELNLVDELFYFSAEMPKVEDGRVTVTNAVTGEVFFTSNNVDGMVTLENIPEGYYNIRIDAPQHDSFNQTILIEPGEVNTIDAFMSRQTVSYYWSVTEIEIEDRYEVNIEAEFEVDVPAPVVVIDPPVIDLAQLDDIGDVMTVELTATNHGLIAVNDFLLEVGQDHPFYEWDIPVNAFDLLDAKSSVTIPIQITRVADFDTVGQEAPVSLLSVARADMLSAASTGSVPCSIPVAYSYNYPCGPQNVNKGGAVGVANVQGNCGSGGGGGGFVFGGGGGGFGGGGSSGGSGVSSSVPTLSVQEICDYFCDKNGDLPGGAPICIPGASTNVGAILCAFNLGAQVGTAINNYNDGDLGGADAVGVGGAILGCIPGVGDILCAWDWGNYLGCILAGGGPSSGGLGAASAARSAAAFSTLNGPAAADEIPLAQLQQNFQMTVDFTNAAIALFEEIFGTAAFQDAGLNPVNAQTLFQMLGDAMEGDAGGITDITDDELNEMIGFLISNKVGSLTVQDLANIAARWNASVDAWSIGIIDPDDLPEGMDRGIINLTFVEEAANTVEEVGAMADATDDRTLDEFFNETILDYTEVVNSTAQGVCASVRIKISQDAVMTRQAFLAELEIENGLDSELNDISINLIIRDSTGALVSQDTFGITDPALINLTAIDGTGVIAGGETGSAAFTIIPSRLAAADSEQTYTVSGTLGYRENGVQVSIPLREEEISVRPQAELELDYFLQRNVFSDDPFTEEVEESEPFALGLLVNNVGAGDANNMSITSAQPKIIENEKGLLIDFEIIGSEVNGESVQPTLKADFGDVAANTSETAIWYMQSSLQGKFIDYEVSFTHINSLGIEELSLITETRIHELIQVVKDDRDGADDLSDFFVNEDWETDPFGIPDAIYTSEQEILEVSQATGESADGAASLSDLEVVVTATMSEGYTYAFLLDPSGGDFDIESIVRDSDGKVLDPANYWQTDRTFPPNGRPVYEDVLHILDHNDADGAQTYTVTYVEPNVAPVAVDDAVTIDEDTPTSIDVLANDSDANGDPLQVAVVTQGANGMVILGTGGTVTYKPDANFSGTDSFTYTIADGQGGNATATVDVTVTDQPDPESAVRIDVSLDAPDDPGFVLAQTTSEDEDDTGSNDIWFAVTRTGDLNGEVTVDLSEVGSTDSGDISGSIPSSVTLVDGQSVAYFSVDVTGDDVIETDETLAVEITGTSRTDVTIAPGAATATHTIVNDDLLSTVSIEVALGAGVASDATSADEENTGTRDVTFIITRDGDLSDPVTVNLAQTGAANSADFDGAIPASVTFDPGVTEITIDVDIKGDTALEDDEVLGVSLVSTSRSNVQISGTAGSAAHTIVNDDVPNAAPIADDDRGDTNEDIAIVIDVLGNDSDPEGGAVTLLSVADGVNGTTEIISPTEIRYTPNAGFVGSEDFLYVVEDPEGLVTSGKVTVTVAPTGLTYVLGTSDDDDLELSNNPEYIETRGDQDEVAGDKEQLDGDVFSDFDDGDTVVVKGEVLDDDDVNVTEGDTMVEIDNDETPGAEASFELKGDFDGEVFEVSSDGVDTRINLASEGSTLLSKESERFITTDNGVNRVFGDDGDDVIVTAGGADILAAGRGADVLIAGDGADILIGGLGADDMTGGEGPDSFLFNVADFEVGVFTVDFITDFEVGIDTIELSGFGFASVDDIPFTPLPGGDAIQLSATHYIVLEGLVSSDLQEGDIVLSDVGFTFSMVSARPVHRLTNDNDRFISTDAVPNDVFGGLGDDLIIGGPASTRIFGEEGADVLAGGIANDLLVGGSGSDDLTGRAGADEFRFTAGEEIGFTVDFISDFEVDIDTVSLVGFGLDADGLNFQTLTGGELALQLAPTHFVVFEGFTDELQLGNLEDQFDFS